MTGLQTATDIVAIVCMGVITITWFALLILAFVVRRKLNRMFDSLEELMDIVRGVPFIGKRMLSVVRRH
jgi:threonine/homoserine/homoserine lactone efflux protein